MSVEMKRKAGTLNLTNQRSTLGFSLNGSKNGIQKSVMNTRGYLSTKYRCMSVYPNSVVKKCDVSYDLYLKKLKGDAKELCNPTSNGTCTICKVGKHQSKHQSTYQKDILTMNYSKYYSIKSRTTLPASKAHYPPQNMHPIAACTPQLSLEQFMEKQC